MSRTRFTVIGAGHGGKAMAAHLALMDFHVTLYNRTSSHIAAIQARRGIELESYEGGPRGFGRLALVTSDMHEALATLLNAGRIEATHGDFQFYIDGVTPSVASVLEVLDRERVTVAGRWASAPAPRWNGWRWPTTPAARISTRRFTTSRATMASRRPAR